jgi:hypothetical protein
MVTNQGEQTFLGHHAHAGAQLVEDDQRDRRHREHPQQPIAELGAEDRVRGDSVVGQTGQYARPDDREQRRQPPARSIRRRRRTRRQ